MNFSDVSVAPYLKTTALLIHYFLSIQATFGYLGVAGTNFLLSANASHTRQEREKKLRHFK